MSSIYPVFEDDEYELSVWEGSSKFSIMAIDNRDDADVHVDVPNPRRLTAEQLIDIAVKMMQPTLYNVEDPEKFFQEVILKKVNGLFR